MSNDRFAPPRAHVEDVPDVHAGSVQLATRGSRFWAVMIDGIIGLIVFWLVSKLTPWNPFQSRDPSLFALKLLPVLGGIAIYVLVHGYLLSTRGQSIGKMLLGIRIVRADGSPLAFDRAVGLRYVLPGVLQILPMLGMLFGLVDALMIFRESRRCLHDLIADTMVVKA
ncbi:MAG: RDD family protein [Rubrivivax sp.]|nr:MAG: RDD family protein [Rubrivivax sp.]